MMASVATDVFWGAMGTALVGLLGAITAVLHAYAKKLERIEQTSVDTNIHAQATTTLANIVNTKVDSVKTNVKEVITEQHRVAEALNGHNGIPGESGS